MPYHRVESAESLRSDRPFQIRRSSRNPAPSEPFASQSYQVFPHGSASIRTDPPLAPASSEEGSLLVNPLMADEAKRSSPKPWSLSLSGVCQSLAKFV